MKLTHFTTLKTQHGFLHSLTFEFENELFQAFVMDTKEETSVLHCFEAETDIEIDIPKYFGKGFASKVFNFIYRTVEIKTIK